MEMKDPKELIKLIDEGKEEIAEEGRKEKPVATGYPNPLNRYRLMVEGFNVSIEEPYFWILDYIRYFHGFADVEKITDIFSAAENSALFGASQQRLGLQQDKVSQFLATVGKMVKELFQLVRELRVLDERLGYYSDSYTESKSAESAEITLKGIWIDMVEQGAKNPASVYGMAREVQFTTLPDLFFSTHPQKQEDVDVVVERDRAQFNRKVREVLKRKLRTFLAWKEHTYEEIKNRRKFTLKYLRQHYEIIRMYMAWVKPYLKNIRRLHMDQKKMDTADLLVAFETSMIEVEILAKKPNVIKLKNREEIVNQIILVHFLFRTRPEMNYKQEGYQTGPIHVGRVIATFRAYAWTDSDIDNYRKMRAQEDFQLLGLIDASVKAAMEALGDELMRYLEEAGEDIIPKTKEKRATIISPYKNVFSGFKGLFSLSKEVKKGLKLTARDDLKISLARADAGTKTKASMWSTYHHFKKHHAMLNW